MKKFLNIIHYPNNQKCNNSDNYSSSTCNKIILFDRKDNIVKLNSSLANAVSKDLFYNIFNKTTFIDFYQEYYSEDSDLNEIFRTINNLLNEEKKDLKDSNNNYVMLDDNIINTDINEELNESDTEKQVSKLILAC